MGVLDLFRLDGKRAVVTGASRGLGRSMALALAEVGADVVITGRTQSSLEATAEEIRARGRPAWTVQANMAVPVECAAADWAAQGITVNAICPGLFMTDKNREWNARRPEVIEAFVQNVPMGRAGEPDEIGPLVVYLASPAASYVTGAAYVIDGGYTL